MRKDVKSVGQILSGLGDLLDGLSTLAETGAEVLQTVGSRTGRHANVTYGWSIGTAADPDVRDRVRRVAPPPPPRHHTGATMPEVFDEGAFIRTVIDVPGVVDGDIRFDVRGQDLTVTAQRHDGRCVIRLRVPAPVTIAGATSSYRNGIFEILLPKASHGSR